MTIGQLNTIISKFPNNWRIESTCEHGYPTKVKSIGNIESTPSLTLRAAIEH